MAGVRVGGSGIAFPSSPPYTILEGTMNGGTDQANVWRVISGIPTRLTPFTDPTCVNPPCSDEQHTPMINPNGTEVVYTDFDPEGGGGQQLVVVPADGSATYPPTVLYDNTSGFWMNHAWWTPDGSQIVFTDADGPQTLLGGEIKIIDRAGGSPTVLWTPDTQSPQREEGDHPVVSPDGTMVAFLVTINPGGGGDFTRQGLWVMDIDGSNATLLDNWDDSTSDTGCMYSGTQIAWSHDSQWIAYIDGGFGITPSASTTYSLNKIQPDGTNKTVLKAGFSDSLVCKLGWGAWAADDSYVICSASASGTHRQSVFQVVSDGSLVEAEIIVAADGPAGGQNFEVCYGWNSRLYWMAERSPTAGIMRSTDVNGLDMRDLQVGDGSSGPDWVVGSGSGFEWV